MSHSSDSTMSCSRGQVSPKEQLTDLHSLPSAGVMSRCSQCSEGVRSGERMVVYGRMLFPTYSTPVPSGIISPGSWDPWEH